MLAFDRSLRSKDADGRLHVELCNISKATVNPYFGREIPGYQALGLHPHQIYNLYRDPKELAAAADTFENIPLLIKHVQVSAEKPEQILTVGVIGGPVRYEHPYLKAPLSIWTQEAIDLVEDCEQEQLSSAYRYVADMTPGTSPEGLRYDGVMRNIIGNHVALVNEGRAGPDVVVADQNPPELPKMRSNFLAKFIALFAPQATPEQVVALDQALAQDAHGLSADEMTAACDAMAKELNKACDSLNDEEREEAYKRAAKDKSKPAQDAVPTFTQADVDAARAAGVEEGKAQAAQIAADAAQVAQEAAAAEAVKVKALQDARTEVASVVGEVACDSAQEVFAFALKQMKIDVDGVDPSAYPAMFRLAASKAVPERVETEPVVAADARTVFPFVAKIRRG